ncbi:hypothetical protein PUR29_36955 [Methylobacterium ajmalii]|uniref:Uncharacterized protein n=1 Tax=Methylobacterium ajmalii TaxID=2738439 RepID=A0ABV0A870_9HYPH
MIATAIDHGRLADLWGELTITARHAAGMFDTIIGRHPALGLVVLVLDGAVSVVDVLSELPLLGHEPAEA